LLEVTRVLSAIQQGDPRAAEELLPLVYEQLSQLAARKLSREKPGQTLDATALVHEAYLRLVSDHPELQAKQSWSSRGHFFAAAAERQEKKYDVPSCRAAIFPFSYVESGRATALIGSGTRSSKSMSYLPRGGC
jgi:hypothetical protein